jgi:hypothetical protein
MKIELTEPKQKPIFKPFVLTLETEEELSDFINIVFQSYKGNLLPSHIRMRYKILESQGIISPLQSK